MGIETSVERDLWHWFYTIVHGDLTRNRSRPFDSREAAEQALARTLAAHEAHGNLRIIAHPNPFRPTTKRGIMRWLRRLKRDGGRRERIKMRRSVADRRSAEIVANCGLVLEMTRTPIKALLDIDRSDPGNWRTTDNAGSAAKAACWRHNERARAKGAT